MNLSSEIVPPSKPLEKLKIQRVSVKCHRRKHTQCKNCGCKCHLTIIENTRTPDRNLLTIYRARKKRKLISDIQILDDYVCGCWREFWRPIIGEKKK